MAPDPVNKPREECRRPTPLSRLTAGAHALFERSDLPSEEQALLGAMGLHPQARMRIRRTGKICIVQIGATRLALADALARRIQVTPLPEPSATTG